jgi:hypothetical protein
MDVQPHACAWHDGNDLGRGQRARQVWPGLTTRIASTALQREYCATACCSSFGRLQPGKGVGGARDGRVRPVNHVPPSAHGASQHAYAPPARAARQAMGGYWPLTAWGFELCVPVCEKGALRPDPPRQRSAQLGCWHPLVAHAHTHTRTHTRARTHTHAVCFGPCATRAKPASGLHRCKGAALAHGSSGQHRPWHGLAGWLAGGSPVRVEHQGEAVGVLLCVAPAPAPHIRQ